MDDRTIADLMARIEQLETQRPPRRRRPRARLVVGALTLIALLAVPIGAFASHSFTDVPDSNTFHTNIGRVKGAGITAGCTPTTYCPDANVTRGQMAAFLGRTGGRADSELFDLVNLPAAGTDVTVAAVTVRPGDVTGGAVYVMVNAEISGYTLGVGGCRCVARFEVQQGGVQVSNTVYVAMDSLNYSSAYAIDSMVVSILVAVPSGVETTFQLVGAVQSGSQVITAYGNLTGVYIPFAGSGANASLSGAGQFSPAGPADSPNGK